MKIIRPKLKWIEPFDFWRLSFIHNKSFDAIILVQHNGCNPELGDGYETLHIFRFKKKGVISINAPVDKFKFEEFNPELNYEKIAIIEYFNT